MLLLDGFAYDPDLAVSGFVIPYRVAARHVEIRPAKPRGDGGALHPAGPSLRADAASCYLTSYRAEAARKHRAGAGREAQS